MITSIDPGSISHRRFFFKKNPLIDSQGFMVFFLDLLENNEKHSGALRPTGSFSWSFLTQPCGDDDLGADPQYMGTFFKNIY